MTNVCLNGPLCECLLCAFKYHGATIGTTRRVTPYDHCGPAYHAGKLPPHYPVPDIRRHVQIHHSGVYVRENIWEEGMPYVCYAYDDKHDVPASWLSCDWIDD